MLAGLYRGLEACIKESRQAYSVGVAPSADVWFRMAGERLPAGYHLEAGISAARGVVCRDAANNGHHHATVWYENGPRFAVHLPGPARASLGTSKVRWDKRYAAAWTRTARSALEGGSYTLKRNSNGNYTLAQKGRELATVFFDGRPGYRMLARHDTAKGLLNHAMHLWQGKGGKNAEKRAA